MNERKFSFRNEHLSQMLLHIMECFPEEGCGFVGGRDGLSEIVIPVANSLHSSTRFLMDPEAQLRAMQSIEENNLEISAIFHSHPYGPPTLSETDIEEYYYPDNFMILWFPIDGKWQMQCFSLENNQVYELKWNCV